MVFKTDEEELPDDYALRLASVVGTLDRSGTRSSDRWCKTPGAWDSVHVSRVWPSTNELGIPDILPDTTIPEPGYLVPYGTRLKDQEPTDGAVHFFLDDHRFETVWNRPNGTLQSVSHTGAVLSPDFSVWRDWPLVVQHWNIYRNRWCARWWQYYGLRVIPTVSWSDEKSYSFCFLGIPKGVMVAVSSVGIYPYDYELFLSGYHEMLKRLEPSKVLWYGKLIPGASESVPVRRYETRWESIRKARKEAGLPERPPKPARMSSELRALAQEALSMDTSHAGRSGGGVIKIDGVTIRDSDYQTLLEDN